MTGFFRNFGGRSLAAGAVFAALVGAGAGVQANETVAVKHALYGAGYDIDNVSPEMGDATREALKAFQKDHPDLAVTGEVDEPTRKALGIVSVEIAANSQQAGGESEEDLVVPAEPAAADAPPVVTEEDDGGWSFF